MKLILKGHLGFNTPTVDIGDRTVWEEGDDAEDMSHNLKKILCEMGGGGIVDGAIINVEDFSQDLEIQVVVEHMDEESFDEEKNPQKFIVGGKIQGKKRTRSDGSENDKSKSNDKRIRLDIETKEEDNAGGDDNNGGIVMMDEGKDGGDDDEIEIL